MANDNEELKPDDVVNLPKNIPFEVHYGLLAKLRSDLSHIDDLCRRHTRQYGPRSEAYVPQIEETVRNMKRLIDES